MLTVVRIIVDADPRLGAVELAVEGAPVPISLVLGQKAALNLSLALANQIGALQGMAL